MKYSIAIFDLDGTLLNTLDDLVDSVNHALATSGMPTRTTDEIKSFLGNGFENLIKKSVPEGLSESLTNGIIRDFKSYYHYNCMLRTKPYDGICDLLGEIRSQSCKLAVVSNKGDAAVKSLCEKFFPNLLDISVGEREGIERKPSPDTVLEVLKLTGISASDAVYIGDSEVDILTAANAGIDCISVDWGYRTRDELLSSGAKKIASNTVELFELLN